MTPELFYQSFFEKFTRAEKDCYYHYGKRPEMFFISQSQLEQLKHALDQLGITRWIDKGKGIPIQDYVEIRGYKVYRVLSDDQFVAVPPIDHIAGYNPVILKD